MNALKRLPGWLLALVWLAVPAVALALVLVSLADDDDSAAPALVPVDVDVQTPALQAQRERAGVADCSRVPTGGEPVDGGLPELALPCLGGVGSVDLATVEGPALVNVWAQTCNPCREEMPVFQQLHERVDEVTVLGVDFGDLQPDLAIAFAAEAGVTYPSVADVEDALPPLLDLPALPTTYFVAADGEVVASETRAYETYAELAASVQEHLGVAA